MSWSELPPRSSRRSLTGLKTRVFFVAGSVNSIATIGMAPVSALQDASSAPGLHFESTVLIRTPARLCRSRKGKKQRGCKEAAEHSRTIGIPLKVFGDAHHFKKMPTPAYWCPTTLPGFMPAFARSLNLPWTWIASVTGHWKSIHANFAMKTPCLLCVERQDPLYASSIEPLTVYLISAVPNMSLHAWRCEDAILKIRALLKSTLSVCWCWSSMN